MPTRPVALHPAGNDLSPGWYLVEGIAPDDIPEGACGSVQIDAKRIHQAPMGRLRAGKAYSVVIVLPANTTQVTASVVSAPGTMPLAGLRLRRVSRLAACGHMLAGIREGARQDSNRRVLNSLALSAKCLLRGRLREAGNALFATYQSGLRTVEGIPLAAGCGVRARRFGAVDQAGWVPINQLQIGDGRPPDKVEWEATGDDPQFRLERAGRPMTLPAGWYRIECAATIVAGRLIAPALYPDYGDGCMPEHVVRLPEPDASGRIRALVLFGKPVMSLRFDPGTRPVRFVIEHCALHRVGRVGALMLLLGRYRCSDGSRDWPGAGRALGSFFTDLVRHGLSVAATRLHEGNGVASSTEMDYANWIRLYDTLGSNDRSLLRGRAHALANGPVISILLPVYETPERWLKKCLDSVLAQAYEKWELCIVDDASPSRHVSQVLAEYAKRDKRIRVMHRDRNGHISAASNDALGMATGSYVGLLDHDDELRPHALLEMAELLARHPDAALVYSDEDKIDERGRRFQPNFKPDWNPDLLLSQNYLCHFTVICTETVRHAGGFRTGFEGSQDHDLFLRCVERVRPDQIRHIAKVLYHWRAISGSTALERSAKDYASVAGVRAVADHLSRVAPGASAQELAHGHYRVRWPLPSVPPKVSLIIPTRDKVQLLRTCVESVLAKTSYPDFEIIVVDNQSSEPETLAYFDALRRDDRIRVLAYDAPFNYSAINNWAVRQANGDVLCLLNNDIEVISDDWLEELVGQSLRPGVGAVGAMLYYPDRTIQHAGVILGLGGVANHIYTGEPSGHPGHAARALVAQNLSAVTGACLVVKRTAYEQMDGLDERLQVAFNDIDFCLRLREAGYRNLWTPFAELVHHESASRGRDESEEKRARFLGEVIYMESRWRDWLDADPAYSPNLSLLDLNAGLAFPPRASV